MDTAAKTPPTIDLDTLSTVAIRAAKAALDKAMDEALETRAPILEDARKLAVDAARDRAMADWINIMHRDAVGAAATLARIATTLTDTGAAKSGTTRLQEVADKAVTAGAAAKFAASAANAYAHGQDLRDAVRYASEHAIGAVMRSAMRGADVSARYQAEAAGAALFLRAVGTWYGDTLSISSTHLL